MIDKQLLESAKIIRRTFLKSKVELSGYEKEVKELVTFLKQKVKSIEVLKKNIRKEIKSKQDIETFSRKVVQEIEEIELEEKRIEKKINKINLEMEQLARDEQILYQTIKERYPDLTLEQIISEIHQNLED